MADRMAGTRTQALRPLTLAGILMGCAGDLTGLALAQPTPMVVANALLFWAWTATALRFSFRQAVHEVCRACGAMDPLRLPDGACAMCAAPVRKSFPGIS
jgi:hypothetical protein